MEDFRRCLERQERETNERNRIADEINELHRQVDEQVVIAVTLQDEENQGRRRGSQVGRYRNVDRHRHSRGDEIARIGKSTTLEALHRLHALAIEELPNCLASDYENRKGQKSIILEAVAGFDIWVWHAFYGVAGSQNDLNVLGQSPVFNDVLRGQSSNIAYQVNNTVY
ncbi:hypothetical protein L3X38_010695 [Prunus dulcis]|uniref:Uncharacterized protein n=1 Tax=Prunus dulcis TaxID=3755 RepID=A0AAD4ZEF3_PRUDU|nr:hypothetical protein L3X38_010695 [Prunus dulcis]